MQTIIFLLLKKFKNTEGAQLCKTTVNNIRKYINCIVYFLIIYLKYYFLFTSYIFLNWICFHWLYLINHPDRKTVFLAIFCKFSGLISVLTPKHNWPHKIYFLLYIETNDGSALKHKNRHKLINLGVKNGPVGWNGLNC